MQHCCVDTQGFDTFQIEQKIGHSSSAVDLAMPMQDRKAVGNLFLSKRKMGLTHRPLSAHSIGGSLSNSHDLASVHCPHHMIYVFLTRGLSVQNDLRQWVRVCLCPHLMIPYTKMLATSFSSLCWFTIWYAKIFQLSVGFKVDSVCCWITKYFPVSQ